MSGHSKFANIKHKKEKNDAAKGKVFTIIILTITGACMCAGVSFAILKALGFYPELSVGVLGTFIGSCTFYLLAGIFLIRHAYTVDPADGRKILDPRMLKVGKIFLLVIMMIQYNFIAYMVPSREFWAYLFFWMILVAFFLDVKMLAVLSGALILSTVIVSVVRADTFLPVNDTYLIPEMALRVI